GPAEGVRRPGSGGAEGAVRNRRAGPVRAPPVAVVPGLPGRPGPVRGAVAVFLASAPALCRVGHVRPALRPVPHRGGVRSPAGRGHRLPGLRLADDGAVVEPAAGRTGAGAVVVVAPFADAGATGRQTAAGPSAAARAEAEVKPSLRE